MTDYIKVTQKEFDNMRAAVASSHIQSGCWENSDQLKEIALAVKSTKAIEKRNKIDEHINWDEY